MDGEAEREAGEKQQVRCRTDCSFEGFCPVCCKACLCCFPLPRAPSSNPQHKEAGTQERRGHEKVRLSGKHKGPKGSRSPTGCRAGTCGAGTPIA